MFENRTTYDKAAMESMARVYIRRVNRWRFLLRRAYQLAVGLASLVCGLLLLLAFGKLDLYSTVICVLCLVMGVVIFPRGLFFRQVTVRQSLRALRRRGDSPERRLTFSEEAFHVSQPMVDGAFQYASVQGAYETEGHFVLALVTRQGVIVDKSGFTQGTAEGFRAFLEQKLGKPVEFVK